MIQLANDPNANRPNLRADQSDGKGSQPDRNRRSGHAWPFLSRYAGKPTQQEASKPRANDSGS
jgi:hypothetical protein